ncbi:MAG: cytochrome P450 [Actinobacteria bacterium]|nr:cytochrome P450 [Actinomycetota bacterium]
MRAEGPVLRGRVGQWLVPRYADVATLLKDRSLSSDFPEAYHRMKVGDGPTASFLTRVVIDRDPPDHTALRHLVGGAFGPGQVRNLEARIAELVDGLLDEAVERADGGAVDMLEFLAVPLPVLVVCELLGLPASEWTVVRPHATDLTVAVGEVALDDEARQRGDAAVTWLREYLGAVLRQRSISPQDDLLSAMGAAVAEGTVGFDEAVDNAVFLFFAGFVTTTTLLATGCALLADHPDELRLLVDDPSLVPSAVEEFLRFDAPVQMATRLVRTPVVVGGRTIRPGRLLMLLLGSANRDETRFERPDRLDVRRRPNSHVAFGGGMHHCLGAHLARLQGAVAFSRMLARFSLAPADPPVRRTTGMFRTFERVTLALTPR